MACLHFGSPAKKPFLPAFHRSSAERCKLEWTIVNFHGYYNNERTLDSNIFTASCSNFTSNSMWRLKINPKHLEQDTEYVTFVLERCHTERESCPTVTAHVTLGICKEDGEICFNQTHIKHFCEGDMFKFSPIIVRKDLLEDKKIYMPFDILTVHCELDIYTSECREFFDDIYLKSPPELKELSNNMKEFFHAMRNADINMSKDDAHIKCHKAILSSRSQMLASLVKEFRGDDMELENIHKDAVVRFFEYIYAGDLSLLFVESNQSNLLSKLFEAAKSYQISDLESFLEPEVIHCRSVVPAYKYKFDWKIAKFEKCVDCSDVEFDGPTTKWFAEGETDWQVSLSIRNMPDSKLATVRVNLSRTTKTRMTHQVLLEVAFRIKGGFVGRKTVELMYHEDRKFGVDVMSREQILTHESILYHGGVTVHCSFVVSSTSVENTTEMSEFNIVCDLEDKEDSDLRKLSSDFAKLFDRDQYKNMTINVRDGGILKVHQCIIDARCRCLITEVTLRNRLAEMPTEIVESFLKFLYTGDRKCLRKHALQLYLLADDLNLEELKQQYSSRLGWILSAENVLRIIREAHRIDDRALKSLALTFIKNAARRVLNSEQFKDLKAGSPALAAEIIAFVG